MPLLFTIDKSKKYYGVFKFDESLNRWYIEFEEIKESVEEEKEQDL